MSDEIDYNSASWQQGYWEGREELRPEDVTAEANASYQEGKLMGYFEVGIVFEGGICIGHYTPELHTLHDLENNLVAREAEDV